jgi:hypothetical protein
MLVKANQPELLHDLEDWFNRPWLWRNLDSRTATLINKGHGRIEQRAIWVSAACGWLNWPDVEQVIRCHLHQDGRNHLFTRLRYYQPVASRYLCPAIASLETPTLDD